MLITVYKITCNATNDSYIGSTISLPRRLREHAKHSQNQNYKGYNLPLGRLIREHGWENFTVETLAERHVDSVREKQLIESVFIEIHNPALNSNKSWVSQGDKVHRAKEYYRNNRDSICQKVSRNRAARIVCECGAEICQGSKLTHKLSRCHREWQELAGLA